MENKIEETRIAYMNPYLAGFLLGLTLLASFLVLGTGLGASGAIARLTSFCELCINPERTLSSAYFGSWGKNPLNYYLVFMFAGVFVGGFISALFYGRISPVMERGNKFPAGRRFWLALFGGIIAGFATRLARGCTSGQALTGTALLLSGSLAFLIATFAGGYLVAYFFREQWHD